MEYRTYSDLSNLIRKNISKIPHDIDLVVGVPRSGMIPAYMIALYLNCRVTDIDSFVAGQYGGGGVRSRSLQECIISKVLVVDDTVRDGDAMQAAKNKLQHLFGKFTFVFLAPIVSSKGKEYVDIWFESIDGLRIFEWNVFHHSYLKGACLDIDGVLNVDPSVDDDGPIYSAFLDSASPMFVPKVQVGTLVTCRLEKWRKQTEQWLQEHGVQYDNLVMLNMTSKEERMRWGRHGEFKGNYYKNSNAILFIESSISQANKIAEISHKPVLCLETNSLVYFTPSNTLNKSLEKKAIKVLRRIIKWKG